MMVIVVVVPYSGTETPVYAARPSLACSAAPDRRAQPAALPVIPFVGNDRFRSSLTG